MSHHQPLTDTFFENFDLHPSLLSGLHATGFTRCTPIQALTLPHALQGRDIAGQAQTGTGKTAAFLVAVLNRLLTRPAVADRKQADPRALILAPTRELAIQIDKDFRTIGRDTGLTSALIYGGVDYDKQREMLKAGVDIVIATPGRIIDYLKQHVVSFHAIEAVVLDEADRMFDLGFIKDIRFLFRRMPPREERQSLLFSATLSHRVLELAYEHMNEAEKLTVETENVTADRVRQVVYFPAKEEKQPLLIGLLSRATAQRSMVFVNTKAAAERVHRSLERHGFRVGTLSGDVPQTKREKLLGRFARGEIELLVATDVAARGLHIPEVSHVYNYDLPHDPEDYVHRIGRTARLGAEGDAISFACDLYAMGLPDIEAYIGQKIPVEHIDPALLIAPPRREGAPPIVEDDDPDEMARNTRTPAEQAKARSGVGTSRGGRPGSRGGSGGGERRGGPSSRRTERKPAEPVVVAKAEPTPPPTPAPVAATGEAGDAPRKRRRRRGGRGRDQGAADAATQSVGKNPGGENGIGERKPRRDRGTVETAAPMADATAPAAHKKPGFFHRIARFFGTR